jgi:transposase
MYMRMKIKILTLSESEQKSLTYGFRNGESHCLRMRCRAVLLKSEGLSSARIGEQTEMTAQSVNGWVKRFESEGIKGLYTRLGQGRKPIMDCSDEEAVRKAIESDRQSVRAAKETWQNASGKEVSDLTFRRFLSALAQDIDV